jgi:hypothetical protein
MILFKCTECGGALKTSNPNLVGKKIKCPKCGAAVPVPAESDKGKGKVVPSIAPGPRPPAAAGPKAGASTKPSAPKRPAPASEWEDAEAPVLPTPKAKKPGAEEDWGEEEAPAAKKPATKSKKKGGIDLVAILVLLLLAGYATAVVLFMLDIVYL